MLQCVLLIEVDPICLFFQVLSIFLVVCIVLGCFLAIQINVPILVSDFLLQGLRHLNAVCLDQQEILQHLGEPASLTCFQLSF